MSLYDCSTSPHELQTSEELHHYATVQEEPLSHQELHENDPTLISKSIGVGFVNVGLLGSLVQSLHGVTDDQRVHAQAEYTVAEQLTGHMGNVVCDMTTGETQRSEIESANRQLRVTIHNSDSHLWPAQEGSSHKVPTSNSEIQIQRELICSLSAEVEYMRDHIESLQGRLYELQRKEDSFRKQMKSMASELAHCKALIKERDIENKNLKRTKQNLQHVLIEGEKLLCEKHEVVIKQEKEITYNQKTIEGLHNRTNELEQTICNLKQQLDLRGEEIIPGAKNASDACAIVPESNEQPETERESSPVRTPAENTRWNEASRWQCYAKGALVGVGVGITIVGIFAYALSAR